MTPTLQSWTLFTGIVAMETAVIILLAASASRFIRQARRRRVCWQAALLAVSLIFISELANLPARISTRLPNQTAPRRLVVTFSVPAAEQASSLTPSALHPKAVENRPVTWPGWLWLAGTLSLLLIAGFTRAWLLIERRNMQPADLEISSIAKPLFAPLGLRYARICTWRRVRGPVAFGFWRPTVALPPDFKARFTPPQQKVMLAHELAHLAAHDPFWFALADLFCALAWWHPLAWWMRRQFHRACEAAADEASALVPDGPATLAESLVTFGRELSLSTPVGGLGVGGSGFRSDLALRVKALLAASPLWRELPRMWRWAPRVLAILCAALTVAQPIHVANPGWLLAALLEPSSSPTSTTFPPTNSPNGLAAIPQTTNHPKSISFLVQFVELPENDNVNKRELDALFGDHLQESKTRGSLDTNVFADGKPPSQRHVTTDLAATHGQAAVLDPQKFTDLRRRLLDTGVDWLAAPRVETLPGRQAQVSTLGAQTIVFDVKTTDGTSVHPQPSIDYETGNVLLGPTVDIVTHAGENGCRLDVVARFVEFLGYDDPGTNVPTVYSWVESGSPSPKPLTATLPLPHFRVRQAQASIMAQLGQTVAMRGPIGVEAKKLNQSLPAPPASNGNTNRLYIFVTLGPAATK